MTGFLFFVVVENADFRPLRIVIRRVLFKLFWQSCYNYGGFNKNKLPQARSKVNLTHHLEQELNL